VILRFSFNAWSSPGDDVGVDDRALRRLRVDPFHYKVLVTTLRVSLVTTGLAVLLGYPVLTSCRSAAASISSSSS
jgi:ABC-type spermidine/putrescine transport system permease subunit I